MFKSYLLKPYLMCAAAALCVTACSNSADTAQSEAAAPEAAATRISEVDANAAWLKSVLAKQDDKNKLRFDARRPEETLTFFGITGGMKVAEALPGGGWYSKILIPFLGDEGILTGMDYSMKMWPEFSFMTPERIEAKKTWPADWTADTQDWRMGSNAGVDAYTFGTRNTSQDGTYDAVLFIRALHNFARFEDKGGYFTEAVADTHAMLRTGGIVGVVQHSGPETHSDEWANGSNGYLKKSAVIAAFEAQGFKLVGDSDLNSNPKDNPSEDDIVWRLPPTLNGSKDDPEKKAAMEAIGESNRMTLKFEKI